jgi:hypothetical protein
MDERFGTGRNESARNAARNTLECGNIDGLGDTDATFFITGTVF